jgi:hypothetical protein
VRVQADSACAIYFIKQIYTTFHNRTLAYISPQGPYSPVGNSDNEYIATKHLSSIENCAGQCASGTFHSVRACARACEYGGVEGVGM